MPMSLNETLLEQKGALLGALRSTEADKELGALLPELRAVDIAEILEGIAEEDHDTPTVFALLDYLPVERRANVFGYLPAEVQGDLAEQMPDEKLLALLEEMGSDERADLYNLLDE